MNNDQIKGTVKASKDKAHDKPAAGNAGQQGKIANKEAEGKAHRNSGDTKVTGRETLKKA